MLKQRVLTALLLLPLLMAAIFSLPSQWFLILIAIVLLGASLEYRRLAGLSGQASGLILVLMQAAAFIVLYLNQDQWDDRIWLYLVASCTAWLLMFARLPLYRPGTPVTRSYQAVSFITALVSVTTGWFAVSWLFIQSQGSWLILLLLLIVWAADVGAYFTGSAFGKRKLTPRLSPGKTVAGLVGGVIAAPLVALVAINWMPLDVMGPINLVLLSLLMVLVSVGGDLLISLHKRTSGFKDSGNLLPGHGGILDRLDSLLAAAPFFALGLLFAGI